MDNQEIDTGNEQETNTGTETAPEEKAPSAAVSSLKDTKKILLALVVVVLLIGGALAVSGKLSFLEGAKTLAVVNGEKIKQAEFDVRLNQILSSPQAQALNLDDPSVRDQVEQSVLDEIINTRLLLNAAINAGYTASDEDVQNEYDQIVDRLGSADILAGELEKGGIDDAKFRQNIHDQLIIQQYIDSQVDPASLEVTDDDVNAFYDQIKDQDGVPPLEDIRSQIEDQLTSEKQQTAVGDIITSLRDGADIEYK